MNYFLYICPLLWIVMISFVGHHGTDTDSAKQILEDNYKLSVGDSEWLGDGVYFFVKGIDSKTLELAEKWAKVQSWDNDKKTSKYKEFCILESKIEVKKSEFLDLTTEEGVRVFSYLVEKFEDKITSIGKKLKFHDGLLLNLARKESILPLEVVKGDFYIKFEKERMKKISLRTSNCTICAVYNPSKSIFSKTIIRRGHIK